MTRVLGTNTLIVRPCLAGAGLCSGRLLGIDDPGKVIGTAFTMCISSLILTVVAAGHRH